MTSIVLTALVAWLCYVGWRVWFWLREGKLMQQSGHLPPPPSFWARAFWKIGTRVLTYLSIGPIRVIGRENLKVEGKRIFTPNHSFPFDFATVTSVIGCSFRYMTKTSELKGWRGSWGAWTGAIPVNTSVPHAGELALNASIEAMVDGDAANFLIFPQGKLLSQESLESSDFKHGFAKLARAAFEETDGEAVFVIPMAVYYIRDRKLAPLSHYLLAPLRRITGVTNYGAIVNIGKPIAAQQLPADADEATMVLFKEMVTLLGEASALVRAKAVA